MFGLNDKLTLTIGNARDIDGNIIPFSLKLPLIENEIYIPENLVSVDVFEYQESFLTGGRCVFRIYVCEVSTMLKIIANKNNKRIKITRDFMIRNVDSHICLQEDEEQIKIFALLESQDIVVNNHEKLVRVITELSNEHSILRNSLTNIRTLHKRKW